MAEASRHLLLAPHAPVGSQPRVCREQPALLPPLQPRSAGSGAQPCSGPGSSPSDPGAAPFHRCPAGLETD